MIRLEKLSAYEIGRLINKRKITPTEVIEYFEKRITRKNKKVNAFVYTKFEEAKLEAKKLEERIAKGEDVGPFAGVPFALKDFLPSKKGWTHSYGGVPSLISEDEYNSVFCEAMEKAGGIAIGKTNAPTFGFRGTTDNALYGPTKNPFNLKYNAGGSSGGSAAAVASGLVPIAEGGDAGGSIRIPASWTNLFGFKASVGTIPSVNRPDAYSATHPFCFNGGLTKSVMDTAILLNYMASYNPRDPYSVPRNKIDYVKEMKKPITGYKIAFTYDFDIFSVEDEVKEIVFNSAKKLEQLGASVEFVHFNINRDQNELAKIWCESISIDTAIQMILSKNINREELPTEFLYYNNMAEGWDIMDFYKFNLVRSELYDAFQDIFDKYDIIISPTTTCLPVLNSDDRNTKGPEKIGDKSINTLIGFAETFLVNFTGHPAASVPCGLSENGLPVGMQIIAKRYKDEDVLKVAYNYEKIAPWKEHYKKAKI